MCCCAVLSLAAPFLLVSCGVLLRCAVWRVFPCVWRRRVLLRAVALSLWLCVVLVRCVVWCVAVPRCAVLALPSCPALPPPPAAALVVWLCPASCRVAPSPVVRVVLCCAALMPSFLLFFLFCAVAVAWCRGALLCAVLLLWLFCGAVTFPCCVLWCVLVPWCPVPCPLVLCCFAPLCCLGLLCFSFTVCGLFPFFFKENLCCLFRPLLCSW